jgi:hypothetical protein
MKYQVFKAVDKLDGDVSLFAFDEQENYTVIYHSDYMLGRLVDELKSGKGCNCSADSLSYPRRNDMVNPVLLCEIEA